MTVAAFGVGFISFAGVLAFVVEVEVLLVLLVLTLGLLSVVAMGFMSLGADLGAGFASGAGSVLTVAFFSGGGAALLPVAALIMAATGSEAGVATGLAVSLVALLTAGVGLVSVMLLLPVNAPTPSPPEFAAGLLLAGSIGWAGAPYKGVLGSAACPVWGAMVLVLA